MDSIDTREPILPEPRVRIWVIRGSQQEAAPTHTQQEYLKARRDVFAPRIAKPSDVGFKSLLLKFVESGANEAKEAISTHEPRSAGEYQNRDNQPLIARLTDFERAKEVLEGTRQNPDSLYLAVEHGIKEEERELKEMEPLTKGKEHLIISPRDGVIQFVSQPTSEAMRTSDHIKTVRANFDTTKDYIKNTFGEPTQKV